MLRHFAPFSCRQMIASMVRRRFLCSVLWGGRHCAISGASYSLRVFGQAGSTGKVLELLNSGPDA
jgi:hypothetical protein